MRTHPLIGFRVKAHHPRGGHYTGVVVKAAREEGRGIVLTLDSGASIVPRDVVEKIDPPKAFYVSTYCNFAHSTATGKPIKHECRHIPPAALRLEREGLFAEAIAIMQGRKPCVDCSDYAPVGQDYCAHHKPPSVIVICDDLHNERAGYLRAFVADSPTANTMCTLIGYASAGGSHRTVAAVVAEARRIDPHTPIYHNGKLIDSGAP